MYCTWSLSWCYLYETLYVCRRNERDLLCIHRLVYTVVYRPGYFTVHPPPRLQVDQNFLTQKIVADPKMRCHQKSFGIWRVTEAILGQKTCFFSKNIFWKKFIINHTIFLNFRYAFFRY